MLLISTKRVSIVISHIESRTIEYAIDTGRTKLQHYRTYMITSRQNACEITWDQDMRETFRKTVRYTVYLSMVKGLLAACHNHIFAVKRRSGHEKTAFSLHWEASSCRVPQPHLCGGQMKWTWRNSPCQDNKTLHSEAATCRVPHPMSWWWPEKAEEIAYSTGRKKMRCETSLYSEDNSS